MDRRDRVLGAPLPVGRWHQRQQRERLDSHPAVRVRDVRWLERVGAEPLLQHHHLLDYRLR